MKNNQTRFVVLFAVVAVLIFVGSVMLKGRLAMAPDGVDSGVGDSAMEMPTPDNVTILPPPATSAVDGTNGDEVVANGSAGYYFSMPTNWYVEKNAGTGITVYPDYDPKSDTAPECKIEMSTLAAASSNGNSVLNLNDWVTGYLHADPTADVAEISQAPVTIGGADSSDATSSAVEWNGTLNGVTTTLVYTVEPNRNILEIAPSTLSQTGDADDSDCELVLQALLANLRFGTYEK